MKIVPRFTLVMFWDAKKKKKLEGDLFLTVFKAQPKQKKALDE